MRPPKPPPPDASTSEYVEALLDFARSRGLDRVGVTDAGVLSRSRVALVDRRERGLSDTMGFTFRDPERSTDPTRAVDGAQAVLVGALSYADTVTSDVRDGSGVMARVARYARHDFYTPLRQALQDWRPCKLVKWLNQMSWQACQWRRDSNSMLT